MPRKQMTDNQETQTVSLIRSKFPNKTEREIYSLLEEPKYATFWNEMEDAIGVKGAHIKEYYMESYLRGAYRDTFKQDIIRVDLDLIDHLQRHLKQFNELDLKQKYPYIKKYLREKYHHLNGNDEYEFHFDQMYDHVLSFFKIDGAFVSTAHELNELQNRLNSMPQSNSSKSKVPLFFKSPRVSEKSQFDDNTSSYYGSEPSDVPREMVPVETEEKLLDEETYFEKIDEMNLGEVINQIQQYLDVYEQLTYEESRLRERLQNYKGAVQGLVARLSHQGNE